MSCSMHCLVATLWFWECFENWLQLIFIQYWIRQSGTSLSWRTIDLIYLSSNSIETGWRYILEAAFLSFTLGIENKTDRRCSVVLSQASICSMIESVRTLRGSFFSSLGHVWPKTRTNISNINWLRKGWSRWCWYIFSSWSSSCKNE